jgi:H(+)-transporting ATP synthase subunit D
MKAFKKLSTALLALWLVSTCTFLAPDSASAQSRHLTAQNIGLGGGGKKIVAVRDKFTVFLGQLIKLASLQTSFVTLDEAMKVTNRRVNALENVTIPKIQAVLDYIERELDELEREGKF